MPAFNGKAVILELIPSKSICTLIESLVAAFSSFFPFLSFFGSSLVFSASLIGSISFLSAE